MEHLQSEEPFSSDPYFSDLMQILGYNIYNCLNPMYLGKICLKWIIIDLQNMERSH